MEREKFLKILIEQKFSNIKRFSEHINLPYTTVRTILENGVGNARVDNVIKICQGLGISPEDLSSNFKTNNIIADTLTTMLNLEESKQNNIFKFAQKQLELQNNPNSNESDYTLKNNSDFLSTIMEKYSKLDDNYKKFIENQINQLLELQNNQQKI